MKTDGKRQALRSFRCKKEWNQFQTKILLGLLLTMFWLGLDKCQVPIKTALSLPLLSWTGERKYDRRLED